MRPLNWKNLFRFMVCFGANSKLEKRDGVKMVREKHHSVILSWKAFIENLRPFKLLELCPTQGRTLGGVGG